MNTELLSTIGLCKRAGMLAVGEEPVESVARGRDARLLLLASDAGENTARRIIHFAEIGQCLWIRVPFSKEQLGRAVGRSACAVLAVTDIGFASSIARRLAASDPDAYGQTAERLGIKAQRAAQRKTEEAIHEKNLRRGKKRAPAEPKIAEKPSRSERKPFGGKPSQTGKPFRTERKPFAGKPSRTEKKPFSGKPGERSNTSGGRASAPSGAKPYQKRGPGSGKFGAGGRSKPSGRPANPFARSRPVKRGKGSFRKKDG